MQTGLVFFFSSFLQITKATLIWFNHMRKIRKYILDSYQMFKLVFKKTWLSIVLPFLTYLNVDTYSWLKCIKDLENGFTCCFMEYVTDIYTWWLPVVFAKIFQLVFSFFFLWGGKRRKPEPMAYLMKLAPNHSFKKNKSLLYRMWT